MKRKATRRILSIIMVLAMIVPMCVMSASAATIPYTYYEGNGVYGTSIKGYTMYRGKTYVYTDASLTGYKITSSGSREYIDGTDEVTIVGFNIYHNSVKVRYPIWDGSTKTRWASADEFFPKTITSASKAFTSKNIKTYKKYYYGSDRYGYIEAGDTYYKLGTLDSRTRVIYPIPGGYKMAWINNEYKQISLSSEL